MHRTDMQLGEALLLFVRSLAEPVVRALLHVLIPRHSPLRRDSLASCSHGRVQLPWQMHVQCTETAESYECAVQTLLQLPAPNFKLFVYLLRFVRELMDWEIQHRTATSTGTACQVCMLTKDRMAAVFADALAQVPRSVMPPQPPAVRGLRRFVALFLDRREAEANGAPECGLLQGPPVVFVPSEPVIAPVA
jgi:hypothetical protein